MNNSTNEKIAIILAAGIGSRLYPLTEETPKSLIKVNGREILDYQIAGYIKAGLKAKNIFVITGYKTEMIEKFLDEKYPEVNVIINADYLNTNNMYSLYLGLKSIKIKNLNFDSLIINNADCIYSEETMCNFINSDIENSIAVQINTYIEESMKISLDDKNNIINISKNINKNNSSGVSVDFYKYSNSAVTQLYNIIYDFIEVKKDLKQWTEVAFPILFQEIEVQPYNIKNEKWIEIDNLDDLITADKLFSNFNLKNKKAIICDLDGTLFIGNNPIEPAINFIKEHSKVIDFYYLTNNTSKIPEDYVKKISNAGIELTEKQIITPIYPLIDYLKNKNYKSIYLVANKKVTDFIQKIIPEIKIEFDINNNEAVILTYDDEINYSKLKNISILLNNKKIKYIATHIDNFCPSEENNIPDIGSFIELIYKTTNKKPDIIFGKPSTNLINKLINKYGNDKIAITGDRIYTDKKLADNANIDFICVLSGETTRFDIFHDNSKAPSLILKNLGELSL